MKVTMTYKISQQISPDEYEVYTEVIHIDPSMTFKDFRMNFNQPPNNLELHYDLDEEELSETPF